MQELELRVSQQIGTLDANFDELKDALKFQMTAYADLDLSEESAKERKSDLAVLRKMKKAIEDRRKEIKKDFNQPYVVFEDKVKELIALIEEPISTIDAALKEFEARRVEEKRAHIAELYETNIGAYRTFLPLSYLMRDEWLNKSTSDKAIVDTIQVAIISCENAINAIKALNSPIEEELLAIYARTHDVTPAITRATDFTRDQEMIKATKEIPEAVVEEILEETSYFEENDEEEGEIINKAEWKDGTRLIRVKEEDYTAACNVLTFNEIWFE